MRGSLVANTKFLGEMMFARAFGISGKRDGEQRVGLVCRCRGRRRGSGYRGMKVHLS